jgi:hypothetical protein
MARPEPVERLEPGAPNPRSLQFLRTRFSILKSASFIHAKNHSPWLDHLRASKVSIDNGLPLKLSSFIQIKYLQSSEVPS